MDGTITPARLPMTEAFAQRFEPWCASHSTFIATGSDFKKVQEQLSPAVLLFHGQHSVGKRTRTVSQ